MTNATIILLESVKLMQAGAIKGTGTYMNVDGQQVEIPEAIHTYSAWKSMGYQVKKGSKAVASFPVWKYRAGTKEVETSDGGKEEIDNSKMFMKVASFFTAEQVEAIAK